MNSSSHRFRTSRAVEAYSSFRHLWDTPIFESRSFVALPTVGALVEGWLLIVPRVPSISFAELSDVLFSEFEDFLAKIVPIITQTYGPVSVFEHGPSCETSAIGCGVNYAHMHLMPWHCDLLAGAKCLASNVLWQQVESIRTIQRYVKQKPGYWFVQQDYSVNVCHIGTCIDSNPPAQLFRKVIAKQVGRHSLFDWKADPGKDVIAATVKRLCEHAALK
jgi:diadenosine tetraphosphate (Ap4A) HIT family hydrolase